MNLEQHPKLRETIDYGYEFNISQFFQQGLDLVKRNTGGFIAYTLVYFAIVIGVGIIPILGNIAGIIIGPPLAAGWFIVANKLHKNTTTEFGDFFKGFDYLGQLILVYIISALIYLVVMTPAFIAGFSMAFISLDGYNDSLPITFIVTMLIVAVPVIYLAVSWRWAPMFVVFYNMGFWDAMETSRKIVTKRWFAHFALGLVIMLFFMAAGAVFMIGVAATGAFGMEMFSSAFVVIGILIFFVAMLLVAPFYQCVEYSAFANVTRLIEGEDRKDDLVDHLVE